MCEQRLWPSVLPAQNAKPRTERHTSEVCLATTNFRETTFLRGGGVLAGLCKVL